METDYLTVNVYANSYTYIHPLNIVKHINSVLDILYILVCTPAMYILYFFERLNLS